MSGKSYVSHSNKYIAFWSTKCACTAIARWFLSVEKLNNVCRGNKKRWLSSNGYENKYMQSVRLINDAGYRSVYFTRNPYNRAVSAFLNKFYIYGSTPLLDFTHLEPFAKEFIRNFNRKNGSSINEFKGISFEEYLSHVKYLMDYNLPINDHWSPQIPKDVLKEFSVDYIVRQESFNEDLSVVNSKLGLFDCIPNRTNVTKNPGEYTDTDEDLSSINSFEAHKNKLYLSKNNLLSDNTINLINDIYRVDFEFFNYDIKNENSAC